MTLKYSPIKLEEPKNLEKFLNSLKEESLEEEKAPETPIAKELWEQLMVLYDPKIRWVRHSPQSGETCLVLNRVHVFANSLSQKAVSILTELLDAEYKNDEGRWISPMGFNDTRNYVDGRQIVTYLLEEAVELAIERGI